ncbi:MAG: hypothetical protein GY909_06695 [Oligoflexia bacterium]|nr:hypothetical protein [Oligoflexia bacterium]
MISRDELNYLYRYAKCITSTEEEAQNLTKKLVEDSSIKDTCYKNITETVDTAEFISEVSSSIKIEDDYFQAIKLLNLQERLTLYLWAYEGIIFANYSNEAKEIIFNFYDELEMNNELVKEFQRSSLSQDVISEDKNIKEDIFNKKFVISLISSFLLVLILNFRYCTAQ